MKVILEHIKGFKDYVVFKEAFEEATKYYDVTEILCGSTECSGVLAVKLAYEKGYYITTFPPNVPMYGRNAGKVKNEQLVANGDFLIAFHDDKDKCMENLITQAEDSNLRMLVVYIKETNEFSDN